MPCFYPLAATRLQGGKIIIHRRTPGIAIKPSQPGYGQDLKLPCGRCTGCKLDRSKQWAIRLMCEAQLHERCSFLTLTYNDETLGRRRPTWEPTVPYTPPSEPWPAGLARPREPFSKPHSNVDSLSKRDAQLFMKRLRFNLTTRNPSTRVRFYLVGEYGERYNRPHYHVALFGEDFADDRQYKYTSDSGHTVWRSSRLEDAWSEDGKPMGNCEVGELTIDSAAYVASYVMKKVNGKMADEHYRRDLPDGQTIWLTPEFALMSRGGRNGRGLAYEWLTKYSGDVYPHDHVIHDGRKLKPPRYFDKLLEEMDPAQIAYTKLMREMRTKELAEDNTPARLAVKETVQNAKMALKQRQLEN